MHKLTTCADPAFRVRFQDQQSRPFADILFWRRSMESRNTRMEQLLDYFIGSLQEGSTDRIAGTRPRPEGQDNRTRTPGLFGGCTICEESFRRSRRQIILNMPHQITPESADTILLPEAVVRMSDLVFSTRMIPSKGPESSGQKTGRLWYALL